MIFRQLFDPRSSTYTYLLADRDSKEAILIDPVYEEFTRDRALLRELGLTLRFTVETHVHADHVTSASLFRDALGSRIVVARAGGAEGVDVQVAHGDELRFGQQKLEVRSTPGHTNGCISLVTGDHRMVFTGDALLIRAAGRTDFQQGDARSLFRSVHEQLFSLPEECVIYPGHDYKGRTSSSIGEEKSWNPRLGGDRSEDDFVGYMSNLGLPHPKQIDVAVPANLRCGRGEGSAPPAEVSWGPVVRSYGGVPEIDPEWVAEHRAEVLVLDVRESAEFNGELGHIEGAELLPLGDLRARLGGLNRTLPIVVLCRSGGRSAQAALILEGAGVERVANVRGGMIRWRALGLPVASAG